MTEAQDGTLIGQAAIRIEPGKFAVQQYVEEGFPCPDRIG
jgi:hypothetical protein